MAHPLLCLEPHRVPWLSANGSSGSQHQMKAAFFFHSWWKGQVGHCLHELWALNSVHVTPSENCPGSQRGEGGGSMGKECVWCLHCCSPNNKVRYKKGAFGSSCNEHDKRSECRPSLTAHGGVSVLCLSLADLLWDGDKIFAGETKAGVNWTHKNSTLVIMKEWLEKGMRKRRATERSNPKTEF